MVATSPSSAGSLTEAKKNRIGYMPEERGLYKDLKLEPTLVFLATLKGIDEATARAAGRAMAQALRSLRLSPEEGAES